MEIKLDDLGGTEIQGLLREHLQHMYEVTPAESVHALDIDALRAPDISVWSLWQGEALLGCGALKTLDARHGEVKFMRTARAHLREGVAAKILLHLIDVSRSRGYTRLSLETGSMQAFAPATLLYEKFGFVRCGPFADYSEDPNSLFMTLHL